MTRTDFDPHYGGVVVFTDGSAYHGDRSGGWAYVCVDAHGNEAHDSGHWQDTTISQMELRGPTEALYHLWKEYGACTVAIYADSEYVVLGCNDRTRKRLKNKKHWEQLDFAILLHNHVEFHHVKGHSTSKYNGLADKLAGEARKAGQEQCLAQ
jgi:ribonuclease HI